MMIANEFDRITANYLYSADVQNSNFILVLILKKTLIWFGMSLVRFSLKKNWDSVWIL